MNVLVLGGGGREHALIKALKASKRVKQLSCAPGNPGIALEATCYITDPTDIRKVADLVKRLNPDLVMVGPEAPLAAGVVDHLRQLGVSVFGPTQAAAQLETSKVFSKNFMNRHGIPTARSVVCTSTEDLLRSKIDFSPPWVMKADGLAAGKGVRICNSENELSECSADFFRKKILGKAADQVLLEEFIDGDERSVIALVADGRYALLPVSQDYKRLLENNSGPNTGGMGSFAPLKAKPTEIKKIEDKVISPTLEGLKKDKLNYRGALYFGIMMRGGEPYVLEYNVRFGDPEAQVILPLLAGDWADTFLKVASGKIPKLDWKKESAVCVVVAAPGYPDNPKKGLKILIDRKVCKSTDSTYLLHASTASHNGFFTNGGRVLNSIGIDKTLSGARKKAYKNLEGVSFLDMHFRKDIASKEKV